MPQRLQPLFWLVGAKGIRLKRDKLVPAKVGIRKYKKEHSCFLSRLPVITGAKSVILKMVLSFVTFLSPWLYAYEMYDRPKG